MKKSILIIVCTFICANSYGQEKTKGDTGNITAKSEYKANPYTTYHYDLQLDELQSIIPAIEAGIIPYLETTQLPISQLEAAKKYYGNIIDKLMKQYHVQATEDTLEFRSDTSINKSKLKNNHL